MTDDSKFSDGQKLADYISALKDFKISGPAGPVYDHMGATMADAILQSGLNYQNVVYPRIQAIIQRYPGGNTTSAFLKILAEEGHEKVLDWKHHEKPARLMALVEFIKFKNIETVKELQKFLLHEDNLDGLRELRGIGPKTVDYLKMLVGIQAVAVDRHIWRFVEKAGINCKDYVATRSVVEAAANILGLTSSELDHSIWLYMSA